MRTGRREREVRIQEKGNGKEGKRGQAKGREREGGKGRPD
jgi:hypothetical protein